MKVKKKLEIRTFMFSADQWDESLKTVMGAKMSVLAIHFYSFSKAESTFLNYQEQNLFLFFLMKK